MSVRNDPMLNAGPRLLIAFSADNADVKFPHRLQITTTSHEMYIYDVNRASCVSSTSVNQQNSDLQAAMSAAAGYFGGYTAKEQPIGAKETRMLGVSMEHKAMSFTKGKTPFLDFVKYSRCLVRDLEAKGLARTAVEGLNLSIHADDKDVMNAECYRTFPTCTFPAASLLKREEVECGRISGVSIITAVLQNKFYY